MIGPVAAVACILASRHEKFCDPFFSHILLGIEQELDQHGFAGSDVAGEKQKALVLSDPVFQGGQGLFVLFAKPQKIRIHRDFKGLSSKIVK